MNAHSKIPSDIIGLSTPSPLSRRGFFITPSPAPAARYTLAARPVPPPAPAYPPPAGPVRPEPTPPTPPGRRAGEARVRVAGGNMPVYFARPEKANNPPVILVSMEIFGLHEYIKDVTRRLAKAGAFAI